jgi:hypothetical protein
MNTGSLGIYNNCSLLVNDGGTVKLNHNTDLYIKEDATMVVAGGAEVFAAFGSRITVEEGGVLRIGGGGLLRLSQESSLDIKKGGLLILEDGAIIQLWDGQQPDGRAVVRVEGTLQIDDEFNFSGNGYFHFFPTHELILLGDQFSLEGIAQDSRFLELEYGTTLNFGAVDLELRNGRIVYGGQTMIEQSQGASLRLANTRHDGVASAVGISAQGLTNLLVTSAQFNNLETGLELFDLDSPATSVNSLVSNCTFRNCNTGLFVSEGEQLFIQHSVFQEGTYAMLFNRVLSIRSSNNEVSEYLNPQPNGPIEWGAIVLSDVPEFVSSGDDIHDNDIGIFAPATNYVDGDLNQTNIILRAQSTVRNHAQYGVYLAQGGTDENGLDYGLVLMDCANLLDNAVGIAGTDVLLQIDAIENSGSSNSQYWRSNSFRRPIGGSLFNICYEDRSDITEVSAQGNYWFDPNITSTIQSQHLLQNANIGQGCVGYYPNMPVDVSNFVAQ